MTDVAIVGGGVIGLSIALRCAKRGLGVAVHDPAPGSGASTVAAGMLAPVTEAHYGEEALTSLALASLALWPAFAAELGLGDAYTEHGTLLVALDHGDRAELDRQHGFYARLGLASHRLTGGEARALEPLLSTRVRGGVHAPGDHQADPRRLHAALLDACRAAGVAFVPAAVTDPSTLDADRVVVCTGARDLLGLPVRPVHGQVLRLRGPAELRLTVRGIVGGRSVYVVPRPDGEVVVGASSAERGFDTAPRAGDAYELLRDALDVLPELAEYELREVRAGLRPGTPDNAPILGRTADPRVIAATGHYRNGVLLAPVTAELITALVVTGEEPSALQPFHPRRFQ
ncbi:glycine oxidase ThiO [Actinorhabdospora filicis]|uniref:glycine oxidase n=1 Tax=Actinorhabdospora filicis TaxID=1785913 RepID=A0A9W6SRK4_9ACTN|nr:glycine oxidase ThiO [Actinorhabdospora filicis]GLZ80937.1 glycine oxidase ThiO [Actinorhabdospora filicis]